MEQYTLQGIYDELRHAARAGDQDAAIAALERALGVTLPRAAGLAGPGRCVTRLSYRGFKPAELAMLAANLKAVVKFEDLPLPSAQLFVRRHAARYTLNVGAPYYKDYLMLRSRKTGLLGEMPMTFLYASRDDAGERLRALERSRPDAIVEAGDLLGFPPCCARWFADVFERSRHEQDTVNDDAVYALLRATMARPGLAGLDPLSDLDLLAFYPCGPTCAAAAAFAERTLVALERSAPASAAKARADLGAPVLFWRIPFFLVFDGEPADEAHTPGPGPGIRYRHAHLHIFPDPVVSRIQRLFGGSVLAAIDAGDLVQIDGGDVVVYAENKEVARLRGSGARPPALGLWDRSRFFFDEG